MKVYIHFEDTEDEEKHTTLKIKIPKKWRAGPNDRLKKFFVDHYNKKFPDDALDADKISMKRKGGRYFKGTEIISECIQAHDDLYIAHAEEVTSSATKEGESNKASATALRCRNYGCQQMFEPTENGASSCKHHVAPPTFHDTKKGWSCCKHRMVYDWDAFNLIEGCATGPHSTEDPKLKFAPSPTVAIAHKSNERAVKLKSVEGFNAANPDAVTAASSASSMMQTARAKPAEVDAEGRVKCVHAGCGNPFSPAENGPAACTYHPMKPVFHDTKKFYPCCKHRVAYDWTEFMAIEGCTKGSHSGTHES